MNIKTKCLDCSTCAAAQKSFNFLYCSVNKDNRKATEVCSAWRPVIETLKEDVVVELMCATCYQKTCECCYRCKLPNSLCVCAIQNSGFFVRNYP